MQEMLLMTCIDVDKAADEIAWFLDSGCSNRMCGKRELFSQFDDTFRKSVKLGNNSSLCVMGKGQIQLIVNDIINVITRHFMCLIYATTF